MTQVWIDTATGTWGAVEDLRVLDLDLLADDDTQAGEQVDSASFIAFLNGASDSEIMKFGYTNGVSIEGNVEPLYENMLENRREQSHFSTVGSGPHPGKIEDCERCIKRAAHKAGE